MKNAQFIVESGSSVHVTSLSKLPLSLIVNSEVSKLQKGVKEKIGVVTENLLSNIVIEFLKEVRSDLSRRSADNMQFLGDQIDYKTLERTINIMEGKEDSNDSFFELLSGKVNIFWMSDPNRIDSICFRALNLRNEKSLRSFSQVLSKMKSFSSQGKFILKIFTSDKYLFMV
jgi:hypothetical protein